MSTDSDNSSRLVSQGDPLLSTRAPRFIPVAAPALIHGEDEAVADVLRSNWISMGRKVAQFEFEFSKAHGKKYGVACCSGTTAVELALAALNVGPGDEVICPTLTMVAVPNSIVHRGAIPVFVDSERESGNMDLFLVEGAITAKTKAIIAPHLYGEPMLLPDFDWPVPVIEDCAESHYAKFPGGSPVGSVGRFACFSYFSNKIICCGEGGMVLCDSRADEASLRSLRSHAFTDGNHFHHSGLAYGARMTDMQGAIGLTQHRNHESILERRAAIFNRYRDRLHGKAFLQFPIHSNGAVDWVMPALVPPHANFTRNDLRRALAKAGVETRTYFHPMHLQSHLSQYATSSYPVAEDLASRGLYFPLYPTLTDDNVDYICGIILSIAG